MAQLSVEIASGLTFSGTGLLALDSPDFALLELSDTRILIERYSGYVDCYQGHGLTTDDGVITDFSLLSGVDGPAVFTLSDIALSVAAADQGSDFVVTALAGNDTVAGGSGADQLFGYAGGDLLTGGAGGDVLYGNAGDDLIYGNQDTDFLFGGQNHDSLLGGQQLDVLYGNAGDDLLYGNYGDDFLFGGADGDQLYGGRDNDQLFGNLGDDRLFGNLGDDVLSGGDGADTLAGGDGADWFMLGSAPGDDVVLDMDVASDWIGVAVMPTVSQSDAGTQLSFDGGGVVLLLGVEAEAVATRLVLV